MVIGHVFSSIIVLVIADIITSSKPAYVFCNLFLLGEDKDFHAFIKKTLRLNEVEKVKFDALVFASVLDAKVKPLSMTLGINVILEDKIVLRI